MPAVPRLCHSIQRMWLSENTAHGLARGSIAPPARGIGRQGPTSISLILIKAGRRARPDTVGRGS
jgi:hypothetical protein